MESLLALYWKNIKLSPYGEVERREFALQLQHGFVRHLKFLSEEQVREEAARRRALAVFHSVAVYENPEIEDMDGKLLRYADVLFDIDVKEDNVKRALATALEEAALLFDVLVEELGLQKSCIYFTFSGSKGIHIYVTCPQVRHLLDQDARRLLAQYVTSSVLHTPKLLPQEALSNPCDWAPYGICKRVIYREAGLPSGADHVDAQVIVDLHRLVRVPGSLNPKSFLACTPLPSLDLDAEEVLEMAKPLRGVTVKVVVEKKAVLPDGEVVEEGVRELDLHSAIYLVSSGQARLDKKR